MSYYNWKTGRWATYNQCSKTPIVARQELTLEKYSLEKIEEAPPRSRAKQIFDAYMRFEDRVYGWMLGKGHHLFTASLVRWLLRGTAVGMVLGLISGFFYLVFAVVMFILQAFFAALLVVFFFSLASALAVRIVFVI